MSSAHTTTYHPEAAWYALQVTPRAELEVIVQLDRISKDAGQEAKMAPTGRQRGARYRASAPYFGLILWHVELNDELRAEVEALPSVQGFVLEPETYLIEFDSDEDAHLDQAITELHRIGRSERLAEGFAPFVLSDAKRLSGERAFAFLNDFYLDTEGSGLSSSSAFIEVKMRYSAHARQLIRELPGVVDIAGGERPVVKRGQRLSAQADLKPVIVKHEAAMAFSRNTYQVYVLQVSPNYEDRIIGAIHQHRAQQEQALFAGSNAQLLINGVRVLSVDANGRDGGVKAFKGYVYVSMHMDVDSWHLIKSTQRVVGFVGGQNLTKVRPVTGREVELLGFSRREAPVAQETIVEVELKYQSGDLVEIIDGPFASYVGEVQDVDAGQELIKLLINPSYTVSEARETRSRFASEVTFQAEVAFSQVKPIEL